MCSDVTQAEAELTIAVWAKYPRNRVDTIGKISVPVKSLHNEKREPQTETFSLREMNNSSKRVNAKLVINYNFVKMTKVIFFFIHKSKLRQYHILNLTLKY
jgi:hypothetical protein